MTTIKLSIIDSGKASGELHMKRDYQILTKILSSNSILHLYEWREDSATYGCLLDVKKYLDLEKVAQKGLSLAKRPTGGGIIFHLWDFAFSYLMPASHSEFSINTLENYAYVNRAVIQTVHEFLGEKLPELLPEEPTPLDEASRHFCMAKPTKYDVMVNGKKVGGAAQRRKKQGFLHQGTISIVPPDLNYLSDLLLPGTAVTEAMQANSFYLLPNGATKKELQEVRAELREGLKRNLALA